MRSEYSLGDKPLNTLIENRDKTFNFNVDGSEDLTERDTKQFLVTVSKSSEQTLMRYKGIDIK